jgi:hypothetical protein
MGKTNDGQRWAGRPQTKLFSKMSARGATDAAIIDLMGLLDAVVEERAALAAALAQVRAPDKPRTYVLAASSGLKPSPPPPSVAGPHGDRIFPAARELHGRVHPLRAEGDPPLGTRRRRRAVVLLPSPPPPPGRPVRRGGPPFLLLLRAHPARPCDSRSGHVVRGECRPWCRQGAVCVPVRPCVLPLCPRRHPRPRQEGQRGRDFIISTCSSSTTPCRRRRSTRRRWRGCAARDAAWW